MTLPGTRRPLLLELDLTEPLADPDPADRLGQWQARARRRLRPTLKALHEAGDDPRVAGLVVKAGGRPGWAAMQELRLGLAAFADSGKPLLAWAESFGEDAGGTAGYVLATACPEVWLQPGGGLGLLGVGLETPFLRGALDKLGVRPEFEQRHEYKNAPDTLQRHDFSEAHREALEAVAESVFADAVELIADARRLPPERVRELVDGGPWTAVEAQQAGLVDRLGYRDQVYAAARERVGGEPELLFADRWRPAHGLAGGVRRVLPGRRTGHVALVEVRGTIAGGRSRRSPMGRVAGSDTVSAQLRAAGADERARAVLLRVDSPGGSAVASEVIWREVVRLREAGTPVVVSMGDLAASGGYYVACPADVIVALPATLTGSIGVFGGKLVVADLLDRLGIGTGAVQRGSRALMWSARRGFDEEERARLAASVDAIYEDFTAKVAAGRSRTREEVEAVARGRVWTGRDALVAGLVDDLGGLRDAARIARRRGGLPADAPVLVAGRVPWWARLTRPRNSDDPRAWTGVVPLTPADLVAAAADAALHLPPVRLR